MNEILKLHSRIFYFLKKRREEDSNLRYAIRKSDVGYKLSEGYYFYGNDEFLAISFWTGFDWKHEMPNISLVLNLKRKEYNISLTSKDDPEKRKLYQRFLIKKLNIEPYTIDHVYIKKYDESEDPFSVFVKFFNYEKKIIDEIIENNLEFFKSKQNQSNSIGFFSEEEFLNDFNNIIKLDKKRVSAKFPYALRSISVNNYSPINKLKIERLDLNSQLIFFTGENGVGKTSLLKAIGTSILNFDLSKEEVNSDNKSCQIVSKLKRQNRVYTFRRGVKRDTNYESKIVIGGYAAYGTSRLKISNDEKLYLDKKLYNQNLFGRCNDLLDFNSIFADWKKNNTIPNIDRKFRIVVEVLVKILPNIVDIHLADNIEYFQTDNNGKVLPPVTFDKLASGPKSLVAMLGDMFVRMFYLQPDVDDVSKLSGIVLIDEVELHFHPKFQRELITILTKVFKRIQFIVTTHSPIPLLGAPKNSIFYTLTRDITNGINANRLEFLEKNIKNMLPNVIYTSELFGLTEVTSVINDRKDYVWTSDNLSDELEFQNLKRKYKVKRVDDKDFLNALSKI